MRQGLVLIPIAGALALSAAAAAGCSTCRGPIPLSLVGLVGYTLLLALAFWRADHALVRLGLVAASGFHVGLAGSMISRGSICWLCMGVAGCCLIATWLTLGIDRVRWQLVPIVMPWTAALALMIQPGFHPMSPGSNDRLHVVAYMRPGCHFCDQLHDDVMPEAVRGLDVDVEYRPATSVDFVDRTPTVVISRGAEFKIVEGLPSPGDLRREIQNLQGARP